MKIIVGFIVIVVMLSGVMAGCKAPLEEEVYREVSVGRMTVSIPTDWQRPEEKAAEVSRVAGTMMNIYHDKSKDAILTLLLWDMKQFSESQGDSWEGWEAFEAEGVTKEDLFNGVATGFTGKIEQPTRKKHRELTIGGREAWEEQHTGKINGEPVSIDLLGVFGDDNIGFQCLVVKEAKWGKFEGTWDKIRDSVVLAP